MKHHTGDLDVFIKEPPKLRPGGQTLSEAAKQRDFDFTEKASTTAKLREMRLVKEKSAPAAELKKLTKSRSKPKTTSPAD